MKKNLYITVIIVISLSLALPSASYSWHYRHYHGCGGFYNNGWAVGAAVAGGILVGAVVGNIITQSFSYNTPQQRIYPVPPSNMAYAYPDPEFVAKYGQKKSLGEWIIVPGQSINGKWVPEHKVWVQAKP